MGNTQAKGARKFLEPEPCWNDYYVAEWRSECARELDRHGGPGRPPVARGDSVTAKLVFLEGALKQDQRRMKQVLQVFDDETQKRADQAARKGSAERLPDFILNTDLRAYERLVSAEGQRDGEGGGSGSSGSEHRDFSLLAKDPDLRKKMMEQRKKMLEYAKGVNVVKGAPAIKPLNLPAIKSKVATNWKDEHGPHEDDDGAGDGSGDGGGGGAWPSATPAEWRVRMHAARRRTMLLVGAMARWQWVMSRRPGPKRLPRVNSFSYYIPQVLGPEAKRFIEEATTVAKIRADAAKMEESPDDAACGDRPSSGGSPTTHPRQSQSQLPAQPAASSSEPDVRAVGGGTPERVNRGPPRRGVSDSGFSPSAAAAAAAAVAEVSGGSGSAGPLASGVVRPKKRPELRKSSSVLAGGHSSDVESYGAHGPPRRLYSGKGAGSMRLPAISGSGRTSSSSVGGAGGSGGSGGGGGPHDVPSQYPHLRQPRAKLLNRVSSSGQGRAGRRQSDGYLAAALPPGIAAAAAAGASVLAAAAAGGGAAASRVGSAVGSVMDRRRGGGGGGGGAGGGRARVSETGVSRLRRDGSETGGGAAAPSAAAGGAAGGSPFKEGFRQSLSGVPGSGASHRRSEAGMSGGSLPPQSPSSGAAAADAAASGGPFLPRIPSNTNVGAVVGGANGNGSTPTKPLTLAQARRLALMGDVSGSEDNGPRASMAMSPSRLGPLKLGAASGGTSCSPDRLPLGSPAGGAGGPAPSILDGAVALRHSREGALLLGQPASLSAAGSPLNSPGLRQRGMSLDSALFPAPAAAPSNAPGTSHRPGSGPGSDSGPAHLHSYPRSSSDNIPSPARHSHSHFQSHPQPHTLGPAPPSGPASPLPPLHLPSAASAPAPNGSSPAVAPASDPPPPLSPTTLIPPPPHPAHPRPLVTTTTTAPAPAPAAPVPHTSTSSSSSSAALPPPGKPPLGPGGERIRSGRSNSASAGAGGGGGGGSAVDDDPRVAKAQQLMSMYANRVNATWTEVQQWAAPTVLPVPEQELFCASDAFVPYKVTVQRLLKTGALAVHLDACADAVQLADGTSLDLWTTDPWVLAQRLRPGSLPLSERIEGLSLGARVMQQLVLSVEALVGREAVSRLTVVLAINDDQRNAVVADIIRRRWYGLKPENLILTAQRKRCGYRYDKDAQAFLEDPSTPPQVLGSGYALCQLAWLGDAFCVTREGELSMLMGRTLLERFADAKVEWLVGRRARDLALLTGEGVLDLQHLAFCLYAADRHSGNMVLQVAPASSVTIPRAYDSTILALKARPASASANPAPPTPSRTATIAASAAGVEGNGGAAGVVDLRAAELSSPVMVEALAAVRKQAGGHDGWVGLQRFLLHVPTLHGMLNSLNVFRPKLAMAGDVARLSLDLGDITADRRVACVAVHTRTSPAILTSPNEVDDLIPLLLNQDHSATFRDIIAASTNDDGDTATASGADGGSSISAAAATGSGPAATVLATKPGIRILLFVAANEVTQLAVNLVLLMARPGRDVVHLVTVVHNSLQMPTGQALVLKFLKQISNAMIEAHAEVLVKGMGGLLEVMEGAAGRLGPNLVVMASAALTMSNLNTASVMGSVTLSVLKRLTLPVAVATSNSKHLVLTQRRTALRCMVLVDATSRPALNFMCSSCMEPMRGDKLVLAGHHPTRQMTTQQQQTQRRLMDNFADIASSHRFHAPYKLQLDGPVDKALTAAADDENVHLVGLQVPLGTKGVPGQVLGLIRGCKGGVLVFRDTL